MNQTAADTLMENNVEEFRIFRKNLETGKMSEMSIDELKKFVDEKNELYWNIIDLVKDQKKDTLVRVSLNLTTEFILLQIVEIQKLIIEKLGKD
jgi:hypothetical protein